MALMEMGHSIPAKASGYSKQRPVQGGKKKSKQTLSQKHIDRLQWAHHPHEIASVSVNKLPDMSVELQGSSNYEVM